MTATYTDLGTCTRGCPVPAEVPWSGERLCWPCADAELDLLAKAAELEPVQIGGFGLGTVPGEYLYTRPASQPVPPTQDELADAIAADLAELAGGSRERMAKIVIELAALETGE